LINLATKLCVSSLHSKLSKLSKLVHTNAIPLPTTMPLTSANKAVRSVASPLKLLVFLVFGLIQHSQGVRVVRTQPKPTKEPTLVNASKPANASNLVKALKPVNALKLVKPLFAPKPDGSSITELSNSSLAMDVGVRHNQSVSQLPPLRMTKGKRTTFASTCANYVVPTEAYNRMTDSCWSDLEEHYCWTRVGPGPDTCSCVGDRGELFKGDYSCDTVGDPRVLPAICEWDCKPVGGWDQMNNVFGYDATEFFYGCGNPCTKVELCKRLKDAGAFFCDSQESSW